MTVLAADRWSTNADLIAAIAELGYINEDDIVLDPTYGKGNWWTKFHPLVLVIGDIALDGPLRLDFRCLPDGDRTYDVVAFDPPYVAKGGRTTSGIPEFDSAYGLKDCPKTPAALQEYNNEGLAECARVLRHGGYLITKCKDYISSGKLFLGTHWTLCKAFELGLECVERFEHVGNPGPQPKGRRQVHARRNVSTMFVFRKP